MTRLDRRRFVFGMTASAALIAAPVPVVAQGAPAIHVVKGRGCGCCAVWVDIMKSEGFAVTDEERLPADLVRFKQQMGVPQAMASCHTAEIEGYVIEGHVPPADVRRLISEKPEAIGLAVPGMPYGSPGMGPEEEREAYDAYLIRKDGSAEVFASYEAAL